MIKGFHLLAFTGILLIVLACSCGDENPQPEIPDVPVSFVIDPNSTEFLEINHIGGWIYLTGGYNGILVYRSSMTEFVAFERACPYDFQKDNARIWVETSEITCACPVCASKFILMDGTPFEGPSKAGLKQYQATFDGGLLYVYN